MLSINYRYLRNLQRLKGNLLLKGLPILGYRLSISYRLIINKLIINLLNELLLLELDMYILPIYYRQLIDNYRNIIDKLSISC